MLDLVYIARFDYLSRCQIQEESAVACARLHCTADEAAALVKAKRQKRETAKGVLTLKRTKA